MNVKQNHSIALQIKIVTTAPDVPTVKTTTTVTAKDDSAPQTRHRSSCENIFYRPVISLVRHKRKKKLITTNRYRMCDLSGISLRLLEKCTRFPKRDHRI